VLGWIGVEFSLSSTPIHPNTCGFIRIQLHPNKALGISHLVASRLVNSISLFLGGNLRSFRVMVNDAYCAARRFEDGTAVFREMWELLGDLKMQLQCLEKCGDLQM